jgi:uncharacterized phage-associated protein
MLSALDVAQYFLSKQDGDCGECITNLKLQKLLYYAQGFYLAMHGEPLFSEKIKAWEHGPVVPQVWHAYKDHGANSLPLPAVAAPVSASVAEFLDEVYEVYGQFSAWRLRELSHEERPWIEAYNVRSGVVLPETMRDFFKTRLVDA